MNAAYEAYIRSEHWQTKRLFALDELGWKCQRCGVSAIRPDDAPADWEPPKLEVHHKTYARLWRERLNDLDVLCDDCHQTAHLTLEALARRRREAADFETLRQTKPGLAKAIERLANEKFIGDAE